MTKNNGGAIRYTVFNPKTGGVYGRDLSVVEAAKAILDHEDPTCAVIADQDIHGGWHLLSMDTFESDAKLIGYFVNAETEEMAWELFAPMVVAGDGFGLKAMNHEQYDDHQIKALSETVA